MMATKRAANVRIGDRLQSERDGDVVVTFVQPATKLKRPMMVPAYVNSGLTVEDAILIDFRPLFGDYRNGIFTDCLHRDQRIKTA